MDYYQILKRNHMIIYVHRNEQEKGRKLEKTFELGKIDYFGRGRKINPVTVDVELRDKDGNPVLSICGCVYNQTRTDCVAAGQCLDGIAKHLHSNQFNELYHLWKLYHLNDLHAGTPEQERALEDCPSRDYGERCEYLKSIGLYEVMHEGKPYKYGHGWIYHEIPSEDLNRIKELLS